MDELKNAQYAFARMAVDKAKLCPVDAASKNALPRVAIVIAEGDRLVGWYAKGHGGEIENQRIMAAAPNAHAEQALLEALGDRDLSAASAYVTLEPCTKKKGKGLCCADLIVKSGLRKVYIANVDPNPDVGALAWKTFFASGIEVLDFPPELRNEALRDNYAFFKKFRMSVAAEDGAAFDYENNGGERILGQAGREFRTCWTNRGNGSIYALDYTHNVAVAKNCTSFEQVDDPGRWFEDSHYTKPVNEGEIVIFRNVAGFALVRIESVKIRTPASNAELQFRYQLRYPDGDVTESP